MPVFALTDEPTFPPPHLAREDGLLAVGGDLSVERLLAAYRAGIFPWYNEGDPVLWWSPDPRLIFEPGGVHVSRSTERVLRQRRFEVTVDTAFGEVIASCAEARGPRRDETWITRAMLRAYCRLHEAGYAHSVECRREGRLVGGLYGVSLGACFFGESMFSAEPNASKVALTALSAQLEAWSFVLIDCQVTNDHLLSLGAREISRNDFMALLRKGLREPTRTGRWSFDDGPPVQYNCRTDEPLPV